MNARSRTNQLLYQAELLVTLPSGDDEHATARQMALEESALALFELALESLLREVTEHARLSEHRWTVLLSQDGPALAELQRLRDLKAQPESWLNWLEFQLERLHSDDGAARRTTHNPAMIAVGNQAGLRQQLLDNLQAAKREIGALRETSLEW
ncbi:hypothetical protein QEN58_10930 [Halomonas alkaliantarctica]|uniref:Flagella synthesis protein FlgN n=1 Tax=Halomonas alkaliantarctica TaxID=232346 RepID=A0ABY8LHD1_9GAMM|nr:DUF6586 family protein [Halomonas alkaliantarctica]WGI23860.1 hypothetical protein QEN58_10930 [Halomonas alkaliantarctica]